MTIAKPGSWLAGYILGTITIRKYTRKGFARGKGELKKGITFMRLHYNSFGNREADKGFVDAILDSIN